MKGWFDAFRFDGGPTLYSFNNRTAVAGDITLITFLTIFATLYVAFLIIFPGIRKERQTTFFAVTLSLFVGGTILITLFGSAWHVSTATLNATYRAFTREKLTSTLGVHVGLFHVNITLQGVPYSPTAPNSTANTTLINNQIIVDDIDYNEQFVWTNAERMVASYREAMVRGLPFPILTVTEYFTVGQDGLSWGGQYRAAGYYAIVMLWISFAAWALMNLMLVVVPRYGAVLMTVCGFLLLSTACGYFELLPDVPLIIHIEGSTLEFGFGWCFWLVLISGGICLLSGVIITAIEIVYPHSFSTILEVDYDTPYDRHIIIEDSRGRRFQRKKTSQSKLEEPEGIGTRILKRLNSSKSRDEKPTQKPTFQRNLHNSGNNFELGRHPSWKHNFENSPARRDNLGRMSTSPMISTISRANTPSVHRVFSGEKNENINEMSMW